MRTLKFAELGGRVGQHHIAVTRLRPGQITFEHTHDFVEIFLVDGGRGTHRWNGRELALERGSLAWIRSEDVHSYQSAVNTSLIFINLAFPASWWMGFLRLLSPAINFERAATGDPAGHVRLATAETRRCGERLHDLLERGGHEPALLSETVAWLIQRLLHPTGQQNAIPTGAPEWLGALLRDMRDPELVTQPINFWQKRAGVSPEHLARTCRRFLDESPTVLLNRARINLAKIRLRQGEEKIAAVAFDVGFQNLGFFYRCFRRFTGGTPKAWLAKHAAGVTVPR